MLSQAYVATKQLDLADASYRARIQAAPSSAWAKGDYASFLVWTNRYDEAIKAARAALALVDYPSARTTLAEAYRGKSALLVATDPRGAQKYARLADELDGP